MTKPRFEIADVGKNCYTINDHGRTVAIITSQGYIDWLLKSPMQDGPLLASIRKETHLSYTLGLKLLLITPTPATLLQTFTYRVQSGGQVLTLVGHAATADGKFTADTTAVLHPDEKMSRYEWDFETSITNVSGEHQPITHLEYNNVYPGKAGKCLFFAQEKEYHSTLMVDRDGIVWRFPHQHLLHYGQKISRLHFDVATMAGFFGEATGNPVVIVKDSPVEPDWGICDMYYDLHCCARTPLGIEPGQKLTFRYSVKYLGKLESEKWIGASRPIPVDDDDWTTHTYPRLDLGMNTFARRVEIDKLDDASGFRPVPPQKVWDREVGHSAKGSLRITNAKPQETAWGAEPPTQLPPEAKLNITGMLKTQNVQGKGAFIRVRYHTFVWHPTPHVEWVKTIESVPVTGTTQGWVKVTVPELPVPPEEFDYLIWLDMVLDGTGVAWLTDVDLDLQSAPLETPALEKGSSKAKFASAGKSSSASGTAM